MSGIHEWLYNKKCNHLARATRRNQDLVLYISNFCRSQVWLLAFTVLQWQLPSHDFCLSSVPNCFRFSFAVIYKFLYGFIFFFLTPFCYLLSQQPFCLFRPTICYFYPPFVCFTSFLLVHFFLNTFFIHVSKQPRY